MTTKRRRDRWRQKRSRPPAGIVLDGDVGLDRGEWFVALHLEVLDAM